MCPIARTSSGRAIWSPNTCVVKPKIVLKQLEKELKEKKVVFRLNQKSWQINPTRNEIFLKIVKKLVIHISLIVQD